MNKLTNIVRDVYFQQQKSALPGMYIPYLSDKLVLTLKKPMAYLKSTKSIQRWHVKKTLNRK